jgi:hypothetical protein
LSIITSTASIQENKDRRKTKTSTFRLERDTLDKLETEAHNKDTSLNMLVNQVLHRYVEWNTFEQKTGIVPVSAPVLIELLERISEEQIVNIAKTVGKNTAIDITLFVNNKVDTDSFVPWFLERMKNCSVLSETKENGRNSRKFILKHQLGYKWSLFHKTVLESVSREISDMPIDTQISNLYLMGIKEGRRRHDCRRCRSHML